MAKLILAIVGGLVIAFALVFATDALFHALLPSATRPTSNDPQAMQAYVANQPVGALIAIAAGWALATFAGASFASRTADSGTWPGWTVTLLFLLATASNFLMVRHPAWMIVTAFVLILAAEWFGIRLFARSSGGSGIRAQHS